MGKSAARHRIAEDVKRVRAEQKARESRRRIIVIAVASIVVLALAAVVTSIFAGEIERNTAIQEAAALPIEGAKEAPERPSEHIESVPESLPADPVGTTLPLANGPHSSIVQNCGVYTDPVGSENAIHSLEHGAVWITYRSGLEESQVGKLTKFADARPYTLLSPVDSLAAPVVLSAWGIQLEVDDASDPRIEPFLVKYVQGEQTPELGARCTGGTGNPA